MEPTFDKISPTKLRTNVNHVTENISWGQNYFSGDIIMEVNTTPSRNWKRKLFGDLKCFPGWRWNDNDNEPSAMNKNTVRNPQKKVSTNVWSWRLVEDLGVTRLIICDRQIFMDCGEKMGRSNLNGAKNIKAIIIIKTRLTRLNCQTHCKMKFCVWVELCVVSFKINFVCLHKKFLDL